MIPIEACLVEGCLKPLKAKGYCDTHYKRWRKHGDPIAPRVRQIKTEYPCEVDGCERTYTKKQNTKCSRHNQLDSYKARKSTIISHYGGQCSCCGLADTPFLTIDHVNNDGNVQRKEHGTGFKFVNYILKNWPDDLTILCFNCNGAKGVYGICPHQTKSF